MKPFHFFIPGMIMLFMTVACSIQEDTAIEKSRSLQELVFTAESGEVETKTVFQADEISIWWSPADEICIYYGESEGDKFTSTNNTEVSKAVFTGTLSAFTGESESGDFNSFWAVYPYDAAGGCDGNSVTATLPSTQIAKAGSFAPNVNISIAKANGLALSFFNACSWFRFSIKKEGVKRVTFRGNNNENIAGKFLISMGDDGRPTAPEVIDGTKEITLHLPNYEAFEVGKMYYVTLFPQVFQSGFTVTFETGTETGSRSIIAKATYLRSKYNTGVDFDKDVTYTSTTPIDFNNIQFADANLKAKLVAAFDTSGDGELSYAEVAAVTSLSGVFGDETNFISFDEFQYFTGVKTIPYRQFFNWNLKSIQLPASITVMGEQVFYGCSALSSLTIPNGVNRIEAYTFYGCSSLTSMIIHDGVTSIGSNAFNGCTSLTSVVIPNSVTSIEGNAFSGCSSLTSITLSNNLDRISGNIFSNCTSLASIIIPDGVTSIGNYAFYGCNNLISCIMPNTVTSIGNYAFARCGHLTTLNLSNSLSEIGTRVFRNCTSLTSLTIPSSITFINSNAFEGCSGLLGITFLASIAPTIGFVVFQDTNNCPIFVPAGSIDAYKTAERWIDYANRIVATQVVVDLGLSVKWASWNLGANSPEQYGDYYAWGEIETKANYGDYANYKWCNGTSTTITKYCSDERFWGGAGDPDYKLVLDPEDDVAHVKLGSAWRMPTEEEYEELINNCTWTWEKLNGQNGFKGTSNKAGYTDNWVFFPEGYYWSSTLRQPSSMAFSPSFENPEYVAPNNSSITSAYSSRVFGYQIRPVIE